LCEGVTHRRVQAVCQQFACIPSQEPRVFWEPAAQSSKNVTEAMRAWAPAFSGGLSLATDLFAAWHRHCSLLDIESVNWSVVKPATAVNRATGLYTELCEVCMRLWQRSIHFSNIIPDTVLCLR
jgi:hypothetical protein